VVNSFSSFEKPLKKETDVEIYKSEFKYWIEVQKLVEHILQNYFWIRQ